MIGLKKKLAHDFTQSQSPVDHLRFILEDNFPFIRADGDKTKISEKEEEELVLRIRERIPKEIFCKSKLKHYILRYREGKRPSIAFFDTLQKILVVKEVMFSFFKKPFHFSTKIT